LRAVAWAERARLDDHSAIRLLDEGRRIARRHRLDHTLAALLMTHSAVSLELGRIATARRDLRAAASLVTDQQITELDFHWAVLLHNLGRLADAAARYRRVLSNPQACPRHAVLSANNPAGAGHAEGG
jgi:tetratricopeptide (TPR) repeat protein